MAFPRGKGRLFKPGYDEAVDSLGDANLQRRALGVGSAKHRSDAGRLNAQFVDVDLTGVPDLLNVDVSHRLGAKPTLCELVEVSNASASVWAQSRPVQKDQWTATNCRVAITLTGAQDGTVLKFRVGGE